MNNTNQSFHIEQELTYDTPIEKVWCALTRDVGQWWAFHIGPDDSTITIDPHPGGHFIERWGDGEGELYATVTHLRVGQKITLEGPMGMKGPGYSKFSYTLESCGEDGTKVMFNHYCHGYREAEVEQRFSEGWQVLLETYLRAWLEQGKPAKDHPFVGH